MLRLPYHSRRHTLGYHLSVRIPKQKEG